MGVLSRIGRATRASLSDLRKRSFGRADKPLSELSDAELEAELIRRRRARAQGRSAADAAGLGRRDGAPSPRRKQLLQYYANLELDPGASLADIKAAYRELMKRYHPDKHARDDAKHRAATELAQQLTTAYVGLLEHLERRSVE